MHQSLVNMQQVPWLLRQFDLSPPGESKSSPSTFVIGAVLGSGRDFQFYYLAEERKTTLVIKISEHSPIILWRLLGAQENRSIPTNFPVSRYF
jgi:hypothetical protein